MNLAALLELVSLPLNVGEVSCQVIIDLLLKRLVCVRVLNDDREARCGISDQTIDELLEIRMQVDRLNVFNSCLHVIQELFKTSFEGALIGSKGHTLWLLELNLSDDSVLLTRVVHLVEDVLG